MINKPNTMKKNILLLILFLSTTTLFAQDTKINISPKTFYNTILLTSKMESETNIDVVFYNINNEEVKKYSYENIATKSFKVDLKSAYMMQSLALFLTFHRDLSS